MGVEILAEGGKGLLRPFLVGALLQLLCLQRLFFCLKILCFFWI